VVLFYLSEREEGNDAHRNSIEFGGGEGGGRTAAGFFFHITQVGGKRIEPSSLKRVSKAA